MAGIGNMDLSELKKLQKKLNQLEETQINEFCESCAKELAAMLLAKVVAKTPAGDYREEVTYVYKRNGKNHKKGEKYTKKENKSGKQGGTLKRGWTGGQKVEADEYVKSVKVNHFGDTYVIEIVNPVEYASYVEYGHRQEPGRFVPKLGKKLKEGWVKGKKMMTISEQEIKAIAPKLLEARLNQFLGGAFR